MGEGNAFIFVKLKAVKKNEKNNILRGQVEHLDEALKSMNSSESLRYIKGRIWKHKPSKTKKRNSARTENKWAKLNLQKGAELTNVNSQNMDTRWNNNLFQSGKAGEDIRAAFRSLRHTKGAREHGEQSVWVDKDK